MTSIPEVEVLRRIAALLPQVSEPVRYFVTSTRWGKIAQEISNEYSYGLRDPINLPNPDNFDSLKIGKGLLVINSKTEDEDVVAYVNKAEAERVHFKERREALRSG